MDLSKNETRKRKSKFDIPPSENLNINVSNVLALASDLNTISNKAWTPATDSAFIIRLEKALQKNFEYIDLKDNQPDIFFIKHSTPSSSSTSKGYYNNLNKSKEVVTLGIGLKKDKVDEDVVDKPENTSIYISGLPLDITETDIDILFSSQGKIKKVKFYVDENGKKKSDCLVTYLRRESALLAVAKLNEIDIGDSNQPTILRVTLADFSSNKQSDESNRNINQTSPNVPENSYFQSILDKLNISNTPIIEECDYDKVIIRYEYIIRVLVTL